MTGPITVTVKKPKAQDPKDIAYRSGAKHLVDALHAFRKKTPKRAIPADYVGLIKYVNELQTAIRALSDGVGEARYQLTGARGD